MKSPPWNPPLPLDCRYPVDVSKDAGDWAMEIRNDWERWPMHSVTPVRMIDGQRIRIRVVWHTVQAATGKKGLFRAAEVLADSGAHAHLDKGVDVSAFQPSVDWSKVAKAGYSFAWIKATEGTTWESTHYRAQHAGAGAAGLRRGAYHFFRSTSPAIAQMRKFVEWAGENGGPLEMGWCLDVEWQKATDPLGGLSAPIFADNVLRAVLELHALTNRRPVLYSAPGFWTLIPAPARQEIAAASDLWIAAYRPTDPEPLEGYSDWAYWQHADHDWIPGIGPCDANVAAGLTAPPTPVTHGAGFDLGTIRGIQGALNAVGSVPTLTVDGLMGPRTREAVRYYQRAAGLDPDGVVGPKTRAALLASLATIRK